MADLLKKLYKVELGGISVPCVSFDTKSNIRVDNIPFINAHGNYQNVMGRDSDVYTLGIKLVPLAPGEVGKGEDYSDLFPVRMLELETLFKKGEPFDLIHPIYGIRKVVAVQYGTPIDARMRNGVDYEVVLHEHVDPEISSIPFLKPIGDINSVAVSMDAIVVDMGLPDEIEEGQTFSEMLDTMQGYIDQGTLYADMAKAVGDRIAEKVDQVNKAVERAEKTAADFAENSPLPFDPFGLAFLEMRKKGVSPSQLRAKGDQLKEYVFATVKQSLNGGEPTSLFLVPATLPIFTVSKITANSVSELCALNRSLTRSMAVKANTVIRVYAR